MNINEKQSTMREDELEKLAEAYLKKVGSHDRPDITKHDFIEGFKAGYSSSQASTEIVCENCEGTGLVMPIPEAGVTSTCVCCKGSGIIKILPEPSQATPKPVEGDGWIDAKIKPENDDEVLIYMAKFGNLNGPAATYLGFYNGKYWQIGEDDKDSENNADYWSVTHWRPLPTPPQSVNT